MLLSTGKGFCFASLNVFNDNVLVPGFVSNNTTTAISLTLGYLNYLFTNSSLTNADGTGNNNNHGSG